MRILHVINTLKTGGAEKLLTEIVPRLKDDGFDVEVAVFVSGDTSFKQILDKAGVRMHIFTTSGSVYNIKHIFRLRKLMKMFDIIHTHNTSPQIFAALANIWLRKKLISTEHGGSNRRRSWKFYSRLDRCMYEKYDKIICISDKCEQNLREYLHSSSSHIVTIYNGINIAQFSNAKANESLRQELPDNSKIITMVAGFRWEKDQDTVIQAMALLPSNFHLCLVGTGPRMDDCKTIAKDLNLDERIHFLGLRTDIAEILKASDYIVMSSHFEGLSLSSLEGMSAGKPFLASDVDGLREVVIDAGVLFPHKDSVQLAREIERLYNDKAYSDCIAKKCISRASKYDISQMVRNYESVYNCL